MQGGGTNRVLLVFAALGYPDPRPIQGSCCRLLRLHPRWGTGGALLGDPHLTGSFNVLVPTLSPGHQGVAREGGRPSRAMRLMSVSDSAMGLSAFNLENKSESVKWLGGKGCLLPSLVTWKERTHS